MTHPENKPDPPLKLILLLFYLSGALALVYEVVWSRMLMQVFGSTALAVGTVLAAWMSGMALGAWLIGKRADRSRHGLRLYAQLEIGIAVFALLAHLALSRISPVHLALHDLLGSMPGLYAASRFLLAFALVLVPTLLMGATLPVLTRYLVESRESVGIRLSTLYFFNTLGAVSGVLLTGFYLVGNFGIHQPVYMAVAGNLLIGGLAWMTSMLHSATPSRPASLQQADRDADRQLMGAASYRLVMIGLCISGFTSFAYEIYWTRSLVFILGNSTYALSMMLSAFLTGIALGGYAIRFLIRRANDRAAVFGWIQVLIGIFAASAMPLLFAWSDPQSLGIQVIEATQQAWTFIFMELGVAFMLMLLPAILIGATFPLAGHMGVRKAGEAGASVGRVYAINTAGNVLGALLPGWFLLSWLGIQKGILAMALLNISLGLVLLFVRYSDRSRPLLRQTGLAVLLLASLAVLGNAPLDFEFPSEGERSHFETLFYREGPLATTKVYRDPVSREKHMSVDGIVIGGTGNAEFKQLLLAHLPKLLISDISTELSVGIGSGILMGESLRHPGVAALTGVEIEPGVVEGARYFSRENHDVLHDPRLDVVIDDIGNFLRTTSGRYHVISADEKTADEFASNGFSYSSDYYALLNEHLAVGGIVAQWVPATLPPSQFRMVLKTFAASFKHVQLWYFLPALKRGPFNAILVGSQSPVEIDPAHIETQFREHPDVYQNLAPYGLTSAEALLPHFVAQDDALRHAVRLASVNSLARPRYEFFYPWDYARAKQSNFVENHDLVHRLWQETAAARLAALDGQVADSTRLQRTFEAEDRYLAGFGRFLRGMPLAEQYRVFDAVLALAPWNDSLRARIYAHYSYNAASQGDPAERRRLKGKAEALYDTALPTRERRTER